MTRDSYAVLQTKIEKEIVRLQKQAEALKAKQRAPIIKAIVRDMRDYQITPDDIAAAFNSKSRKPAKPVDTKPKKTVPPKFKNPETGDTWTGRGKPPRWITDAETAGTPRDHFLIQP
ncbi:DNA-binding protein [Pusillimonas sp. T2]|uniref:H-NS histone family protein n=1 Tax=Pusillimonas sp. T2 TaxID=1548123 RepID=UPI000B9C83C7|nr:H-NS histone family protein [Pusillimonas sp. T2]OXR48529.1 DNA-binding protein [Pusillimonas sp. T2]